MPSSETYQVHQDKSGLLWILTDKGVVKYDGFEFYTYTTENGLSDIVNFRVVEDPNGGVWFIGFNGLLSVFQNGKMQAYKYNHLLEKHVPVGRNIGISLHVKKDQSIVYCVAQKKMIAVSATGKVKDLSDGFNENTYLFEFGNELLSLQKTNATTSDIYLNKNNTSGLLGNVRLAGTTRAKKYQGKYFLTTNYKLYFSYDQRFIQVVDDPGHEIIGLDADKDFLYVGLYKNGLKKFRFDPEKKELVLVSHYLPNYSVTSAYRDFNGTLWITTLENGIFALYDEAFRQLSVNGNKVNEEVRFISGNKEKIIINYYVGKWQQLYPPFLCKDVGKIVYKYNLLPVGDGFAFKSGIVDWSGWKDVDATYDGNPVYTNGQFVMGLSRRRYEIVEMKGPVYMNGYDVNFIDRSKLVGAFYWFYKFRNKKMFILFDEGVFCFDLEKSKMSEHYRPVLRKRINQLEYNKTWGLLAYSSLAGIYHIDMESEVASGFAPDLNIGTQVSGIFFDEKDGLWVVSEKGLFLLEKKNGKINSSCFVNRNLISSAEVMDIYAYNKTVYVSTKFGVQKIDFLKVKKERRGCPIELFSVRAFAKNKELSPGKILPSKTDLIKINLSNRNLNPSVVYKYRFGKDQTWTKTDKGEIVLNNPSNGIYTLEVSYLNHLNYWTKPVKLTVFEVEQHIFLRWYFILLYIGLVIGLFYGVLKYTIKASNRKNELLNRMMELERMALSAQMNPHFIFNSLNSIHSFLLYEENENAEKYLLRFAKLIRQTLSNSRATYITIEEEYETLKNYILLENMRFKNGFTFRIECDFNQLPLTPCIPPMLIQPYVENAIIHGLPKRTQGAELLIRFYKEGDHLKVLIRDNGIGYKESQRNKRDTGHKSYGTQITEERMKSLQARNREGFSVEVSDADESNPAFPGTKVILTIPIPTN
ncbi:histidine kinase [Fluviicola sp.]|uniref:sensor histidine kinase n=1 Tax=Fluviicola sp. TaxID=1917219 RepID=UPI0031D95AB0